MWCKRSFPVWVIVLAIMSSAGMDRGFAADSAAKPPAVRYCGVVTDPEGKPAVGCAVWLLQVINTADSTHVYTSSSPTVAEEVTTDSVGRFAFRTPRPAPFRGPPGAAYTTHTFFARDAKKRLGWPIPARRGGSSALSQRPGEMQIKLAALQDYHSRMENDLGQPIAKTTIEPIIFASGDFSKSSDSTSYGSLPAALIKEMTVETATDGGFILRGVPSTGAIITKITAPGGRVQTVRWNLGKPLTITVPRAASISGSVTCAERPGELDGISLSLFRSQADLYPLKDVEFTAYGSSFRIVKTEKGGAFSFANVLLGKYYIRCGINYDGAFYCESPVTVDVRPGESVAGITVPLRRAIAVRGKVVDQQSGAGIRDVSLYISSAAETTGGRPMSQSAFTDEKGEFLVYSRAGKVTVQVQRVPESYVGPSPSPRTLPLSAEVSQDTQLPPIKLQRAAIIEGTVVDDLGHPVANAEIRWTDFDRTEQLGNPNLPRSDEAGKFTLKGLSDKRISVRIRTDKAIADPMNVTPSEIKGPLKVVVSEKRAFAVCGTVVDDAGNPVPSCKVSLGTSWSFGRGAIGFQVATATTDRDGTFRFGGLWPGDPYAVDLDAQGYDKGASPEVHGSAAETHDFGKLLVKRIGGLVEGKVADASGNPLDAVRVFNWGDGPEPVECKSDVSGRFHLPGLHYGPVYVFAEKEGYRFTRLHTATGTTAVTLTMLRRDEAPPHKPRSESLPPKEEQRLARDLLVKLWELKNPDVAGSLVQYMAQIDLEQARKWSAEMGGKYDGTIRRTIAQKLAATDLDEAISLLAQENKMGYYWFQQLAKRFAMSDPAKAGRLAEEAALRARTIEPPGNITALAEIGALLIRVGNAEAGRKLIGEAAELAAKLPGTANSYSVAEVAVAVAAYDFDRALKLADRINDRKERDRARAKVAATGGIRDPDRALAVLKGVDAWTGDRSRLRLAFRLASTRPEDAMRIVQSTSASQAFGFPKETQAQALRWMAEAVAPRDKTRACELIDQAFAIYLNPSEGMWSDNRRATQAAALAVIATQIGYPDMESVVSRVVASRVTMKHAYRAACVVESSVAMAMLLALVDPATAAEVLAPLEPQGDLVGSGYSGVGHSVWLKAWALADPKHALELAERELTKAKQDRSWDARRSGLLEMVDLWTMPPDQRFQKVARYLHNLSFPDEEM
jgi:protocatechuate 3,4-dioxygenase beta subunit